MCSGFSALVFAHAAVAADSLDAHQVTTLFSGKSVTGVDLDVGSTFERFYDLDGTVLNDAQGFNPTGKWRVTKTGELCVKWDDENVEQCGYIKSNGDGTYTKILQKNSKSIRLLNYIKFKDGNVFALGLKSVRIEEFKQAYSGSKATQEMLLAAANNNLEQFDKAISAGANVNATDQNGKTALFFAVERQDEPLLEKLIEAGADANIQDSKGNTPLIVGTANNHIKMVQLLLHYGADTEFKNKEGTDALTIARMQRTRNIAQIIGENKYGASALEISIGIKEKHITEDQFRQAAVGAFKARKWHVDNAKHNIVSGIYERAGRVFKSRMIYTPDRLIIKYDYAMGSRNASYLRALRNLFFNQIENPDSLHSYDDLETVGLHVYIKNKHISEAQFHQAAVEAFETRKWQVDSAEHNMVSGSFKRGYYNYNVRMIYQPDQLILKLDSTKSKRKENQLYALQTQFFRQMENRNKVDEVAIYDDITRKHISEEQFRLAAVTAFESHNWHVDKAENNVVSGSFKRGDRTYKGRMIYQPNQLIIKFDNDSSDKRVKLLYVLRTRFYREIENNSPQNSIIDN